MEAGLISIITLISIESYSHVQDENTCSHLYMFVKNGLKCIYNKFLFNHFSLAKWTTAPATSYGAYALCMVRKVGND